MSTASPCMEPKELLTRVSEITCPAVQIGEESKVQFYSDGVVVGSTVSFSCASGYNLTAGNATCACEITGNWSCGTPTCTSE